ncbi:MAG: transcriptional repressor NrdR [Chloroflexi bacterium]|nr:transcriptional repressor NrdR [Chloroflexota bacterium]
MKCPYCEASQSKVTDSRDAENGIRRRRECLSCGRRFTTHEQVRLPTLLVEKRDGREQDFDREKLLAGVNMACTRRPIPRRDIDRLVDDIEAELQRLGSGIVQSRDLGLMVLERLRPMDEVAYMRYASVYYDFQNANDFEERARTLREGHPEPLLTVTAISSRRTRQRRTSRRDSSRSGPRA